MSGSTTISSPYWERFDGFAAFLCWTAAVKLPLISGINVGLVALVLNFAVVGLINLTSQFGQRLRQSRPEPADR